MHFTPDNLYHVYNQGNNKQQIFNSADDYQLFLTYSEKLILPYADVIAFCLMPNHFHFMLQAKANCSDFLKQGGIIIDPLTNGYRKLLSSYARVFNFNNDRSGSLFRQKTKTQCLTENQFILGSNLPNQDYYTNCFNYIHQNPVKAGLVQTAADWNWSSYKFYSGSQTSLFGNKTLAKKYCGYDVSIFSINQSELNKDICRFFGD